MHTKVLTRISIALFAVAVALTTLLPTTAQGQTWPQRTVKFIVPLGPGSGVDIIARILADKLPKKWGQSVVVENQPGGDGIVAISSYLNANDTHVLLMSPASSFTAHPYQHEKLPYKPDDMVPLARVSNTIIAYSVPASFNVNTVSELFAYAKAAPGKINWAGATGMLDFVLLGYLKSAGIEFTRVPYRNPVQAATDLAEGRINFYIGAYAIVRPHVQAGKVKMLAITNKTRAAALPNIPTTTEAGYPQLATDGLIGLFTIKNMPNNVQERIVADVKEVLADPQIGERLTAIGQVLNFGGSAEFTAAINEQRAQVAAVGKMLGIKPAQ